jgi:antitoxin component YwqK of YwqJK toxin-antitoxin module
MNYITKFFNKLISTHLPFINFRGDKYWQVNGKLHRKNNLPAIKYKNGIKEYYLNGELHRDNNLPAIEHANGNKEWFVNGERHRDNDLPAIEYVNGSKYWYVNGLLHRDNNLPAVEYVDGSKLWYVNGKLHRLDGLPTIEHFNGEEEWYIYDTEYSYMRVINYYQILTRFGRYCLKKIRMRKLRKLMWIHGELLCMPPKGSYPGGRDYQQMVSYFMSM